MKERGINTGREGRREIIKEIWLLAGSEETHLEFEHATRVIGTGAGRQSLHRPPGLLRSFLITHPRGCDLD